MSAVKLTLAGIEVAGKPFVLRQNGGELCGMDVSHHQRPGSVPLDGQDFLIARAAYGVRADDTCADHIAAAKEAGLLTGAYLFFRQRSGKEDQLAAFLRTASPLKLDIAPTIDLEWNTDYDGPVEPALFDGARWIAEQLTERFGNCMIYTAPYFWSDVLKRPAWVLNYPLWLAHYTKPGWPKLPANPGTMEQWAIHQHEGAPLDRNVARYLPLAKTAEVQA